MRGPHRSIFRLVAAARAAQLVGEILTRFRSRDTGVDQSPTGGCEDGGLGGSGGEGSAEYGRKYSGDNRVL